MMPEKRRTRLFMGRNRKTTSEHHPECEDFSLAGRFSFRDIFKAGKRHNPNGIIGLVSSSIFLSILMNYLFMAGAWGEAFFKESANSH